MDEEQIRVVVRIVLEVLGALDHRPLAAVAPASPVRARRVVTEADVVDATPTGRIVVPRGCVVTPLARDAAAERGIQLVMEA